MWYRSQGAPGRGEEVVALVAPDPEYFSRALLLTIFELTYHRRFSFSSLAAVLGADGATINKVYPSPPVDQHHRRRVCPEEILSSLSLHLSSLHLAFALRRGLLSPSSPLFGDYVDRSTLSPS